MKILIYHWNSYNQKDTEDTIWAMGHEIILLTTPVKNPESDDKYTQNLINTLLSRKYDMLFSINFFPVLAKACYETSTPYVCWNCDSPLLAMYNDTIFYETNFIFTFDYSNYKEFDNLGVKHIYHLPLAANTDHIKNVLNTTASLSATKDTCKYDISFVGSLYEKNSFDNISLLLPDYLCGYFDGVLQAQLQVSGGNLIEKLLTPEICRQLEELSDYHKSPSSFADIHTLFSTTVLGFKAASMQRKINLNKLSVYLNNNNINNRKCFVHLFTDSSHDTLPLVMHHGKVDYHTEMPLIFNQSSINLNMTIPNIKTGIPLRVWDILSCRGFLMTDYRIELMDYFVPDKDIVIFEDPDELIAKADFYLSHDTLRTKICQNAYDKIIKNHTCRKRLDTLFQILSKEL